MDKQMIDEIREWLEVNAEYTNSERPRPQLGLALNDTLSTEAAKWLTALLDYYDSEQARLARANDVFGSGER
jgi:hypothetical protein